MSERPVIIYDQDCGICQRSLRLVKAFDWLGVFDSCSYWDALERYPEATEGGIDAGVRVRFADGSCRVAIEAVRSIAIRTPLGALVAWTLWIPPVKALAARAYAFVASRRHSSCALKAAK
jgi:predicted DCC family thiol-disulfide oxidoreductase YuxK